MNPTVIIHPPKDRRYKYGSWSGVALLTWKHHATLARHERLAIDRDDIAERVCDCIPEPVHE